MTKKLHKMTISDLVKPYSATKHGFREGEQNDKCKSTVTGEFVKAQFKKWAIAQVKDILRTGFVDDPDDGVDNECNRRIVDFLKEKFELKEDLDAVPEM